MTMECPQCGAQAPAIRTIGDSEYCTCGWFGPVNRAELKKRNLRRKSISRAVVAVGLAVCALILYEYKTWGSYMGNHILINAKAVVGAASVEDWQELGIMCATMGRYNCSEEAFTHVIRQKPSNEYALLQLGYAQTRNRNYQSAVASFENLFKNGAAGYISAASYAEAMEGLGRLDEAKTWYYRSIRLEPRAVKTVDALIGLLVKNENYAEALSLIGTVGALAPAVREHFEGRTMALNDLLEKQKPSSGEPATIQLAGIQNMHFIPIRFEGMNYPELFMVDSGASALTLSTGFIERNGLTAFKNLGPVQAIMADGRVREAKLIQFSSLTIGPWKLENIKATVCDGCALLAGKSVLNQFQLSSETVKGVEYLTLKR